METERAQGDAGMGKWNKGEKRERGIKVKTERKGRG